jgi:hypothetical protein
MKTREAVGVAREPDAAPEKLMFLALICDMEAL